jgi:hypothetical protein
MGDNVPPQDIVSWTESEAMAIVALSKEPTGYAHLVGTGLTDNQIKAIEDSLSPEARAAIERWFEIANEQGKRIKDAAYVHKNIIVPLLQNYFPVRGVVTTKSADAMLSALFSAGEFGKGIESGMLKARTGSRSALRSFDFWRTIMDSMVVAERYITGIGPMGEIRSVLANKNIVAAMKAKSPQLYRDLMDHIERVASGRLPSAGGPIATVFDQLSSRAAAATILLNLRSIMVQPVSGITALARLSPSQVPYYMRAIAQMAASPISMTEETRKMSPYMERRPSNLERDLAEMTRIKYVEGLFGKHFSLEQAQEATAIFQKAFDAAVTVPLFRGVYDHYIDTHKSEMTSPKAEQRIRTEAEHAAERAVIDSQSQGELSWLSNMAAGDALHRAFTRYISELIAVQNMVFEWYRNPNKATIKKMMEATLISLGALLVFVIQKGHWPSDWEDAVAAIGSQYTGGIPIFGAMADYVTQKMLGLKPTWYDVSPVGADTIRDIAQGTGKLMAGDYKKGAAQTIEGIAEARGVPGVNGFKRLIRGWDKFSKTHDARYLAYPEREIDEARRSN